MPPVRKNPGLSACGRSCSGLFKRQRFEQKFCINGETYCHLYPSYYSESDIAFFSGDDSGASILLYFNWSENEHILVAAQDERGSGEYIIEVTVNDDRSAAQVMVVSLEGNDLTAYGGSAEGILQAEFFY